MDAGGGSTVVTPFGVEVSGDPPAPRRRRARRDRRGDVTAVAQRARPRLIARRRTAHHARVRRGVVRRLVRTRRARGHVQAPARRRHGSIRIVGAQPSVRKVFEITGLETALLGLGTVPSRARSTARAATSGQAALALLVRAALGHLPLVLGDLGVEVVSVGARRLFGSRPRGRRPRLLALRRARSRASRRRGGSAARSLSEPPGRAGRGSVSTRRRGGQSSTRATFDRSPGIGQIRARHRSRRRRRPEMGNLDEAKGRAKQAVGDLTDDDDLRREGKVDENVGPGQGQARRHEGQGRGRDRQGQGQADVASAWRVDTARQARHHGRVAVSRRESPWRTTRISRSRSPTADAAGARAGRVLAGHPELTAGDPMVVALPRGGVPVAARVARALDAPLDVIIVRKLGVPGRPELAMGAIGEGGIRVLEHDVLHTWHVERRAARRGRGARTGGARATRGEPAGRSRPRCRCTIGR